MNKYALWIGIVSLITAACGSSSTSVGLELDASSHDVLSEGKDTSFDAWIEPDAKVERDTSSHDSWVPETLQEASNDTQGADTGADTEKSCATGQKECRGYKLYQCVAQNTWEYQMGSQDCCTTNGRFESTGDGVKDNQTGLFWTNGANTAKPYRFSCDGLEKPDSGIWHIPSLEQLQTIIIGKADVINGKYYTVCDPALDQRVFRSFSNIMGTNTPSSGGKYWGINSYTGHPVEVDPNSLVGWALCVH